MADIAIETPLRDETRFSVGDILEGSLSIFRREFRRFMPLCAIGTIIGTTAYRTVRTAKEGPPAETLAEVFA